MSTDPTDEPETHATQAEAIAAEINEARELNECRRIEIHMDDCAFAYNGGVCSCDPILIDYVPPDAAS